MDDPGGVLYVCGMDTRILVYESQYAGTNKATAASWLVENIEQAIADLKDKGVSFEQYELPGATREGDVPVHGRHEGRLVQGSRSQHPEPHEPGRRLSEARGATSNRATELCRAVAQGRVPRRRA